MRKHRMSAWLLALLMMTLLVGSAYAAPPANAPDNRKATEQELQDLEKAQLSVFQEKWKKLNTLERAAVYKLFRKKVQNECSLMDQYAKLGLLEQAEADAFREKAEKWVADMEKGKVLPPILGRKPGCPVPPMKTA